MEQTKNTHGDCTPLLERLLTATNLPSLPTVAIEVLKLTRAEKASIEDIAEVIQHDPALTAKLLKVVNSSLFGIPREILSIKQAMVVLGMRTVKVMVLSFSLVDVFSTRNKGEFDYELYWRFSVTTAVAARLLAQAVAPNMMEQAFVAGLLADVGVLAAYRCVPDKYAPVLRAWCNQRRPLHVIELEHLGVTHAEMGWKLLDSWGLPKSLCDAIGAHHSPDGGQALGTARELAGIVRSASAIAGLFCDQTPRIELEAVRQLCRDVIGIRQRDLEGLLQTLDSHVRSTASFLSLQIGQTIDYAQIQMDAAAQLSQLSVEAEADRVASRRHAEQAQMQADRLEREKRTILEVASTDGLTQIANRAAFDKRLDEELDKARANGHSLGLIMLDVDHFKRFNDAYGHQAGDEVLRTVGKCLQEITRQTGFAARYGGEEFAILIARETSDMVRRLAEEVREAIAAIPVRYQGLDLTVTASFGVTCIEGNRSGPTSSALVEEADRYLYQAKRNGRNRVETAF
jgi:two-component system, cell cycle response regulator